MIVESKGVCFPTLSHDNNLESIGLFERQKVGSGNNPTSEKPTVDNLEGDNRTRDNPTVGMPTGDKPTGDNPMRDNPTSGTSCCSIFFA